MALSTFHDHLLNNLTANQMESLVEPGKIQSHKRLNHILRNPHAASLEELLFLSEILKCSPYSLVRDFKLGENTLGTRTRAFLITRRAPGEYQESFEREPVYAE